MKNKFFKLKKLSLIFIFISLLQIIFSVNIKNLKIEEKKLKPDILFSAIEKFDIKSQENKENLEPEKYKGYVNHNHLLLLDITFPLDFYTLDIVTLESFLTDYYSIANGDQSNYISNYFNLALENEFKIKNYFNVKANIDFDIDSNFNDKFNFNFIPKVGLEGDYYFGFYWEFYQAFPVQYNFYSYYDDENKKYSEEKTTKVNSSSSLKLGYEFFRFYGPDDLSISVYLKNDFNFLFVDNYVDNTIEAGIKFAFYNFDIETYYKNSLFNLNDTENNSNYSFEGNSNYSGFGVSLAYKYKWFKFSLAYDGKMNVAKIESQRVWENLISTYVRFAMIY